jgi:dTDP-4-dehydrorhamnose 3,5-epimerase
LALVRAAISGVAVRELVPHADARGVFTELYRDEWGLGPRPVQWNAVASATNVLRGFHCHVRHADIVTVVSGTMLLGLRDLRPGSATEGATALLTVPARTVVVAVPPGVAHGFYFPEESVHVYAVSETFDPEDELGCRWDDPETGLDWPCTAPLLSERDDRAGSFRAMRDAVAARLAYAD